MKCASLLLLILLLKGVEGNPLTSLSTVGTRVGWLILLTLALILILSSLFAVVLLGLDSLGTGVFFVVLGLG